MPDLPRVVTDIPRFSGRLRAAPEDFVVEEIPAYEPAGEGDHTFLRLTKRGLTSAAVRERLAQAFGVPPEVIGMAGFKDRHAVTTQTFSVPHPDPEFVRVKAQAALPEVTIHWARRHRHKLRTGHLRGNRFRIVVRAVPPDALPRAQAIAARLRQVGAPNYYGPQRFGRLGDNPARGRALLEGRGPRKKWLRNLLVSAYQAELFNRYLARRVAQGAFTRLLPGDIAQKAATGGMFVVEDPEAEAERYARGEIHFTGPIFGYKMWRAEGAAGALEQAILDEEGLSPDAFRRVRAKGTRRVGRLWLDDLQIQALGPDALVFTFSLPKGGFATAVLREFLVEDAIAPRPEAAASGA
ncbi:MAG: tRNA pseudouridine(13) synthase TruD [Chloroflexi bacterium]|nr:tRNA pseudouridine(13) synthase TruD [Chloroflexota bacterium]